MLAALPEKYSLADDIFPVLSVLKLQKKCTYSMRSTNATLPSDMPTVSVEIRERVQSYQNISSSEDDASDSPNLVSSETAMSRMKFPAFMSLGAAFILVCAFALLTLARSKPRMHPTGPNEVAMRSVNDAWMTGSDIETTYCKTSCTSQCSSYFSVYGPLCCDWAEGNYCYLILPAASSALDHNFLME